ncbi:PAQR family membrane homeostasis protein TrhA [Algoriphagus limi]|uniref:Hemolysin III family protein n=1 Tax=Algoriphagus limi TaxID=2975273 RepID=A0ABT2G993_9BACT|nr:hemolysin III family protein [Algoriphagus limi]MCS5491774.1 hemolysin III family protein [Algoriphagus limi]
MKKRPQTPQEERANTLSHGFGLVLALVGIPLLIQKSWMLDSLGIFLGVLAFCLGVLMVYSFSTAYHAAVNPSLKSKLQVWDHISIYFLIAGTYSPMVLTILKPKPALIILSIIWGSVLIGTFFKIFFTGKFKTLSVVIYLTMGWLAVFFIQDVIEQLSIQSLFWIAAGGLSYTIGVYFYVKSQKPFYHAIWHLFVLGGTISHYIAILELL